MPKSLLFEATTGATSSVIASAIVYPLDVLTTRVQVTNAKEQKQNILRVIRNLLKQKGPSGLYSGLTISLLQTFASNFGYFWIYTLIKEYYRKVSKTTSVAMDLFLGALAGAISRTFTMPIAVLTTKKQVNKDMKKDTYIDIAKEIYANDGLPGFFRGYSATLVLCVNPALTYGLFEQLKKIVKRPTVRQAFLFGVITKSIATIVTYPYILAKTKIQGDSDTKSVYQCLTEALKAKGIVGMYQGLNEQLSKSVLSQALLFMLKDYLTKMYKILAMSE